MQGYFSAYGLEQEFSVVKSTILLHLFYWIAALFLIAYYVYLHSTKALGVREAQWLVLGLIVFLTTSTLISCFLSTFLLRYLSHEINGNAQDAPLSILNTKGTVIQAMTMYREFSLIRYVLNFVRLKTDLTAKHLISAHQFLFGKTRQEADGMVYRSLSHWMYFMFGATSYKPILSSISWYGAIASLIIMVVMILFGQNSGWTFLFIVCAMVLLHNFYYTRNLIQQELHAFLLTVSCYPLITKQQTQGRIHHGIATPSMLVFDKPIIIAQTLRELREYFTGIRDEAQAKPTQVEQDARIAYIKKHLEQGYPIEILRSALIDAGNSAEQVDALIKQAI